MDEEKVLDYVIKEAVELNLSYMPFINDGGLFVPTFDPYILNDRVMIRLQLPGMSEAINIAGKVIWITPQNALHHVLPGIGVQFTDVKAPAIRSQIESHLDSAMEIGGYTYGIMEERKGN